MRHLHTITKWLARCLLKVQDNMHSQLKAVRSELSKGKCSSKVSSAVDELQYLADFNSSVSQAMAKTMEHLSDFIFVTVANSTLARREAYLSHLKPVIKPDILASLHTAPYRWPPCSLMKFSNKLNRILQLLSPKTSRLLLRKVVSTRMRGQSNAQTVESKIDLHGKILVIAARVREAEARPHTPRLAKGQQSYK